MEMMVLRVLLKRDLSLTEYSLLSLYSGYWRMLSNEEGGEGQKPKDQKRQTRQQREELLKTEKILSVLLVEMSPWKMKSPGRYLSVVCVQSCVIFFTPGCYSEG